MEQLIRIFLPVYFIVYYFIFWRKSFIVYKSTGFNPYVFGKSESAHDYIGKFFKYITIFVLIAIVLYIAGEKYYRYLLPFFYLGINVLKIIGLALQIISLFWIAMAQQQMKNSWRIGIDRVKKTELIQSGLFAYSRNPVFLGTIISLMGFFLIVPNAITLAILSVGYVLIQIQVRLEEEYLLNAHSESYINYFRKVRRWI